MFCHCVDVEYLLYNTGMTYVDFSCKSIYTIKKIQTGKSKLRLTQKYVNNKKSTIFIQSFTKLGQTEVLLSLELLILIKFRNDRVKNEDFSFISYFWFSLNSALPVQSVLDFEIHLLQTGFFISIINLIRNTFWAFYFCCFWAMSSFLKKDVEKLQCKTS